MTFKLLYVGGQYIGTLNGHSFISDSLSVDDVKILTDNPTEDQIISIFNPKIAQNIEHNAQVSKLVDSLVASGLFEEKNGSYYRVGNPISVPKSLLDRYLTALGDTEKLNALDNFWLKCTLNPNVEARENLFWFLDKWGFSITPSGYIVSYRNVNIYQQNNPELHDFVALNYTKIKSWKKSPKNYYVVKNGSDYTLSDAKVPNTLGTLQELYDNLSSLSETIYTDEYTGKFRIKIGEPVWEKREDCDESQASCSRGLHQGGAGWLRKGYYGGVGLVCLVDPQNVLSVPKLDNYGKLRTCEYLPIGLAEWDDEGNLIPVETDLFEIEYEKHTLDELNKRLQEIDPSTQVIHQLTFQTVPEQVYKTIDEYREILESKNVYLNEDDEAEEYVNGYWAFLEDEEE